MNGISVVIERRMGDARFVCGGREGKGKGESWLVGLKDTYITIVVIFVERGDG